MKIVRASSCILFIVAAFISCSKHSDSSNTPLVTQMVITYTYIRGVYNNTYDDKKRLATVGSTASTVTYNAGGFEVISPNGANSTTYTDVNLTDGRITSILSHDETERYNSTFTYDSKGRLINILQTRTVNGQILSRYTYGYSWDNSDNLVADTISYNGNAPYITTYSGFSYENVNTLRGKNFGFD